MLLIFPQRCAVRPSGENQRKTKNSVRALLPPAQSFRFISCTIQFSFYKGILQRYDLFRAEGQTVFRRIDIDEIAVGAVAPDEHLSQLRLHIFLEITLDRPCTVKRIVGLPGDIRFGCVGKMQGDITVFQSRRQRLQRQMVQQIQ